MKLLIYGLYPMFHVFMLHIYHHHVGFFAAYFMVRVPCPNVDHLIIRFSWITCRIWSFSFEYNQISLESKATV